MALRAYRTLPLVGLLAAVSVLSGCATTYNSAGDRYFSVWPFIGSRNPDLQLNYPVPDANYLQLQQGPGSAVLDFPVTPDRPAGNVALFGSPGRSTGQHCGGQR